MKKKELYNPIQTDGIVVYFDIYNFSNQLIHGNPMELTSSVLSVWNWIAIHIAKTDVVIPYLFSDCGFILYKILNHEYKQNILIQCIEDMQRLLDTFLEKGFFVKGGISFGKVFYTNNLLVGTTVLEAVNLEKQSPGVFLILPSKNVEKLLLGDSIFKPIHRPFSMPLKGDTGVMKCIPIFPLNLQEYLTRLKFLVENLEFDGDPKFAKEWRDIYEISIKYLNLLK